MADSQSYNTDLSGLKINRERKSNPPGRGKRWWHLLWILLPILAYYGYQAGIQKITPPKRVRATKAYIMTGTASEAQLVATGYVVAQIKAAVASKATGQLRVLNVEEGDTVIRGQVIAELDNDDMRAQVAVAKANLKATLADSLATGLNYRRQVQLRDSGFATDEIVEAATANYQKSLAAVEAMEAALRAAEVNLQNTIITAPFDGTVLTKNADVGEMVAPFASASSSKGAVVTIADMESLQVEADVSESNIRRTV